MAWVKMEARKFTQSICLVFPHRDAAAPRPSRRRMVLFQPHIIYGGVGAVADNARPSRRSAVPGASVNSGPVL